jgi:curved DNA-binding protein CbpA
MKDYYKILGVADDSLPLDIRNAYRRLALKLHPDKQNTSHIGSIALDLTVSGVNSDHLQSFQEIQEAYTTLSDDFKRMMYDAERQSFMGTSATHMGGFPPPRPGSREPSTSSNVVLRFAEKQQFFDESNARWESLFHERNGHIERRPTSRQASREGGRRPPVSSGPASRGSSRQTQGVSTGSSSHDEELFPPPHPSGNGPPSRQNSAAAHNSLPDRSTGSAMLRRLHPASAARHVTSRGDSASPVLKPPLKPTSSAASPVLEGHGVLKTPQATTSHSDAENTSLPQFRPAGGGRSPSPQLDAERRPRGIGLSISRRKELSIGIGVPGELNRSVNKADVLKARASQRTLQIFFA